MKNEYEELPKEWDNQRQFNYLRIMNGLNKQIVNDGAAGLTFCLIPSAIMTGIGHFIPDASIKSLFYGAATAWPIMNADTFLGSLENLCYISNYISCKFAKSKLEKKINIELIK